jgi:hypothetical protein
VLRRLAVVALLGLLAITWPAAPASAKWVGSSTGIGRARATTPAAPTGLTATCVSPLLSAQVRLDWTASASPWVTQYEVQWGTTAGSPTNTSPTLITGVTTTMTMGGGTWYFTVRATKGSWRSASSNEVSKSITSILFIGLACN